MMVTAGVFNPTDYPRVYKASLWWRVFFFISGVVLVGLGVWCLNYVISHAPAIYAAPVYALGSVGVLLILVGVWQVLSGIKRRVVLTPTEIEVHGVFSSRFLPRSEIDEFQFDKSRDARTLTILPRNKAVPALRAPVLFEIDDAFRAWFSGIEDPTSEPVPALHWRDMSFLRRAVVAWALFATVTFFWKAFAGDAIFVSPNCIFAFIFPALFAGAFGWMVFQRQVAAGIATKNPRFATFRGMSSATRYFFLPLLVAGFLGVWPISGAVPSLIVRVVGTQFEAAYSVVRLERERGRGGSCNHVFTRELAEYWLGEICVSDGRFATLKIGDKIEVEGFQSWFGVRVESYL